TISPLHIGDGTELNLNLDFVQGKDRHLEMLDLEELLQQLAEIPRAVQDLGNSLNRPGAWLWRPCSQNRQWCCRPA
ncbi:MAG: hypothetical protein ACOC3Y_04950, partial [Desulfohalobiaceae bacterium]